MFLGTDLWKVYEKKLTAGWRKRDLEVGYVSLSEPKQVSLEWGALPYLSLEHTVGGWFSTLTETALSIKRSRHYYKTCKEALNCEVKVVSVFAS